MKLLNVVIFGNNGFYRVIGNIYDDIKKRFKNGTCIITSLVKNIEFEGDNLIIFTQHSDYVIENYIENLESKDLDKLRELI